MTTEGGTVGADTHAVETYLDDLRLKSSRRSVAQQPRGLGGKWRATKPVYTAFDGDHFAAVPLMRRHALSRGVLPLNPESVVGYKDSVDVFHTKFGVLKADVAVVAKCESFWIYADRDVCARRALSDLAEGVLLELLWYLRVCHQRRVRPDVCLVDAENLFRGVDPTPEQVALTYEDVASCLGPGQTELLDRVADLDRWGLPELALCVHDPLDSKYADWMRAYGHTQGVVALVPSLVIELSDGPLGHVLEAWLALVRLADTVWVFHGIETRPASGWVRLCLDAAEEFGLPRTPTSWTDVGAPKAIHGEAWALSARERRDGSQTPAVRSARA